MKVLMLSLNFDPEPIGIAVYSSGMARALAAAGHSVEVVCGKPYYPQWKPWPEYEGIGSMRETHGSLGITRCAHYIPDRPGGAGRIVHHASFAASALRPMLRLAGDWQPDLVFAVAPSLLSVPAARTAATRAGAPLWLHIQDFEVEAARTTGLLGGTLGSLGARLEHYALNSADLVSSISPRMCERLRSKGVASENVVQLRNWARIEEIRPRTKDTRFRREWSLGDRRVALCSGNIGDKQGIGTIIEMAQILRDREDIVFVICGEGPNSSKLQAQTRDLANVIIKPLEPVERLGELLATADVCLLPQLPGMADLVLPSKFANMLAAGRPVLANASPGTSLYAEMGGAGVCTTPGDAPAMAAALQAMLADERALADMGRKARHRAETAWNQSVILDDFVARAEMLAGARRFSAPRIAEIMAD